MTTLPLKSSTDRLFWLVAALSVAAIFLFRLHGLGEPLERDIAGYSYIAHQILDGKIPYIDIWDHKPPVTYYVFAIFQTIFGYDDLSVYFLGAFFASASVVLIGLIARELAGRGVAIVALIISCLLAQSLSSQSNQPNCEVLINTFKLLSIWLFLIAWPSAGRKSYSLIAISGLAMGLAVGVKTTTGITFLLIVGLLLTLKRSPSETFRSRSLRTLLFIFSSFYLWIALTTYLLIEGAFGFFWDAVVVYNRDYAQSIISNVWDFLTRPTLFFSWSLTWEMSTFILSLAFIGTMAIASGRRNKLILTAFFAAAALEVATPGKFYAHYYQLIVPFAAIAAAWFCRDMFQSTPPGWKRVAVSLTLASVILSPLAVFYKDYFQASPEAIHRMKYGKDIFIQSKDLGEYLRKKIRTNLSLLNWGAEAGIYYYSKLSTDIPFFYYYPLMTGNLEKRKERMKRFASYMTILPPDIVVDTINKLDVHGFRDDLNEHTGMNTFLADNYTHFASMGSFDIYCHNRHRKKIGNEIICDVEGAK